MRPGRARLAVIVYRAHYLCGVGILRKLRMDELFNPGPFRSVATYHKANLASNWASSGRIYTQLNSANKLTIIRSRNHLTNIGVLNSAAFHFWLLGSEISLNFFFER